MGAEEAGLIRGRGWGCVEVEDVSVEGGEHGGRAEARSHRRSEVALQPRGPLGAGGLPQSPQPRRVLSPGRDFCPFG